MGLEDRPLDDEGVLRWWWGWKRTSAIAVRMEIGMISNLLEWFDGTASYPS
jgi:hypothetical protein